MPDDPWSRFKMDKAPAQPTVDPWSAFKMDTQGGGRSWGDVAGEALSNVPESAGKFATDIGHAIMHPIDTASNLGRVAIGAAQSAGLVAPEGDQDFRPYARAVGKMVKDRYGSMENFKRTLATDPVGAAADMSMAFTGGGGALARAPGLVGRAGEVAGTVGRAINPISAVEAPVKAAKAIAPYAIGDLGTHTGAESIKTAARAGYQGGKSAEAFQESLRGNVPLDETVSEARRAVANLRRQRNGAYQSGMLGVKADQTVLPFQKIDDALIRAVGIKTFKGQSLSPTTAAIRNEMAQAVQDWRALPPRDFHTPEGLDALKQKLGDLRDSTEFGTPSRLIADDIYNAVRQTIIDQAPEYAKVMKAYEQATDQIREIERTLSLNPKASIDTALRKLQSVMRNNVNTNYGQRAVLADALVSAGAPHLMERLSGQALSAAVPRGLGKLAATEAIPAVAGLIGGGLTGAGLGVAATLPFRSPRLMGEAAYYAGRGARPVSAFHKAVRPLAVPAAEAGRLSDDGLEQDDVLAH